MIRSVRTSAEPARHDARVRVDVKSSDSSSPKNCAPIEQGKQEEPGGKAAEVGDPGDGHVGQAERPREGAEYEIRDQPDAKKDARAAISQDSSKRGGRNRIGRLERPET